MLLIENFSSEFKVRRLNESDEDIIFELCNTNNEYYRYCPPMVTRRSIVRDLKALPSGKTLKDKYFIGYFRHDKLWAIMDLIDGYPDDDTVFIGLFMIDYAHQGQGIGRKIIEDLFVQLQDNNYRSLRLAWVIDNHKAERFWTKLGFVKIKDTIDNEGHSVILAKKTLRS